MKILVIEDEQGLREALEKTLEDEGYLADGAGDGDLGLDMILTDMYDMVILDIMLPGMNGLDILKNVREKKMAVPIILLTARSELDDKVGGMNLGADDYLTKPFDMPELLARIRMVMRRQNREMPDSSLRVGNLKLNTQTYEISTEGSTRSVRLGMKEYQVLEYLMANARQVISREQITERVWGYDSDVEYNNADVYISFLRKKMQFVDADVKICSVRGVGYRLEEQDDQ